MPSREANLAEPEESRACVEALMRSGVEFERIESNPKPGACAIDVPILFKSVKLDDGDVVSLDSAVLLRCAMAAQIAQWIRDDLAAITMRHGHQLRRLLGVGGYECRSRNRSNGAPISEHATGNAFDVHKLEMRDGSVIDIMRDREEGRRPMREEIRESACARFTTVLGAGSDGVHEDHLHVDLRERRGGSRLCQWHIR